MTAGSWLIDKSALVRLSMSAGSSHWNRRIERGLVHIATVTLLEVGFSTRSVQEHEAALSSPPVALMPLEYLTLAAEGRAVQVQRRLAVLGQHRAPSVPDLIIAAIAEGARLTVLHHDKDFDLIAMVTGQPVESLRI